MHWLHLIQDTNYANDSVHIWISPELVPVVNSISCHTVWKLINIIVSYLATRTLTQIHEKMSTIIIGFDFVHFHLSYITLKTDLCSLCQGARLKSENHENWNFAPLDNCKVPWNSEALHWNLAAPSNCLPSYLHPSSFQKWVKIIKSFKNLNDFRGQPHTYVVQISGSLTLEVIKFLTVLRILAIG